MSLSLARSGVAHFDAFSRRRYGRDALRRDPQQHVPMIVPGRSASDVAMRSACPAELGAEPRLDVSFASSMLANASSRNVADAFH